MARPRLQPFSFRTPGINPNEELFGPEGPQFQQDIGPMALNMPPTLPPLPENLPPEIPGMPVETPEMPIAEKQPSKFGEFLKSFAPGGVKPSETSIGKIAVPIAQGALLAGMGGVPIGAGMLGGHLGAREREAEAEKEALKLRMEQETAFSKSPTGQASELLKLKTTDPEAYKAYLDVHGKGMDPIALARLNLAQQEFAHKQKQELKPKPLTAEAAKTVEAAKQGIRSLQAMQKKVESGSSFIAPSVFDRNLASLKEDLKDVVGRLRSGGAIGVREEKTFNSLYTPSPLDSLDVKKEKLQRGLIYLNGILQSMGQPTMEVSEQAPMTREELEAEAEKLGVE